MELKYLNVVNLINPDVDRTYMLKHVDSISFELVKNVLTEEAQKAYGFAPTEKVLVVNAPAYGGFAYFSLTDLVMTFD